MVASMNTVLTTDIETKFWPEATPLPEFPTAVATFCHISQKMGINDFVHGHDPLTKRKHLPVDWLGMQRRWTKISSDFFLGHRERKQIWASSLLGLGLEIRKTCWNWSMKYCLLWRTRLHHQILVSCLLPLVLSASHSWSPRSKKRKEQPGPPQLVFQHFFLTCLPPLWKWGLECDFL